LFISSTGDCQELKPRIIDLAKRERGRIGSAAVEALVALKEPRESRLLVHILSPDEHREKVPRGIHFSNILGYLDNILPRLDVEIGDTCSPEDIGNLPPVLQVNGKCHFRRAHFFVIELRQVLRTLTKTSCTSFCKLSSRRMLIDALWRL
jgi:hypothetical protein